MWDSETLAAQPESGLNSTVSAPGPSSMDSFGGGTQFLLRYRKSGTSA